MNFAKLCLISFEILIVLLAAVACNRPKQPSSQSGTTPKPQTSRVSITMHAPDAFYDSPADLRRKPGTLLRSERLKDVILPAGVRGWRILYATSVDDNTPAMAVAIVFAPFQSTHSPRPAVGWEGAGTGPRAE